MDVIEIIVSIVVTSAIWVAIINLFGQGYFDKLNRDWKTKQERDISELQSSQKKEEDTLKNLLKIYKSSTDEIQKKRISASSDLWDLAMESQKSASYLFFYNVTLDSEYNDPNSQQVIRKIVSSLMPEQDYYKYLEERVIKDRKLRLFVNDETWKVYHVYSGFITRLMFEVYTASRENKPIPNWKSNKYTKEFLKLAFTPEDLEAIYRMEISAYSAVILYLEERMIIEMNKLFSGEYVIRDQNEILKKIKEDTPIKTVTLDDLANKHLFQVLNRMF